jgi:hypothetical protein
MEVAIMGLMMWVVVLAPIWMYIGLQALIWIARRLDRLDGRLAEIDRVFNDTPLEIRVRSDDDRRKDARRIDWR